MIIDAMTISTIHIHTIRPRTITHYAIHIYIHMHYKDTIIYRIFPIVIIIAMYNNNNNIYQGIWFPSFAVTQTDEYDLLIFRSDLILFMNIMSIYE